MIFREHAGVVTRLFSIITVLWTVAPANGQTDECGPMPGCACKTAVRAVVILPDTLATNAKEGDLILARYGKLCVGQVTYTPGTALSLTLWGENALTGDPGIPEGGVISYSLMRPATGQMVSRVRVSYAEGDSIFAPFSVRVLSRFQVAGSRTTLHGLAVVMDQQHAQLSWQAPDAVRGFSVEHARDDSTFETLAFVDGHGTTSEPRAYSFRTGNLVPGHHTFRLKQIDLDGSFSYSDQVELDIELPRDVVLSPAYPNPFNPETQLNLRLRQAQQVAVEVYDVLGRRVRTLFRGAMEANRQHAFRFEAGDLASGLYLIQVRGETFHEVRTVTLLK